MCNGLGLGKGNAIFRIPSKQEVIEYKTKENYRNYRMNTLIQCSLRFQAWVDRLSSEVQSKTWHCSWPWDKKPVRRADDP